MDLQTRKILFIQEFLNLESEKIIADLEQLLKNGIKNDLAPQPMTTQEYQQRIDRSLEDSKSGKITEADDLLSEVHEWS